MQRLINILIALDQLLQTIVYLGKYNPDLTISAVIYKKGDKANVVERMLCTVLRKLETSHCYKSREDDEKLY